MESRHRGRISIVWSEKAGWQVEGTTNYGSNVVSFIIKLGWELSYLDRAYVPPNNQLMVHRVNQALV